VKTLGVVLAIIAGLYAAYVYAYPSATIRYRLTLTVAADGAEHTGSGVIQVTYGKNVRLLVGGAEIYIQIKGEAVAVDIPGRGTLFAALHAGASRRSNPEWFVLNTFGFPGGGLGRPVESGLNRLRTLTGRVELAPGDLPLLVRFRDIDDPKTVERIDPESLAATFGRGVSLKQQTIEITRDPVTTGIEKRLTWLTRLKGGYLHGGFTSHDAPLGLHGGDFQREK
jgi:hypothetical protein